MLTRYTALQAEHLVERLELLPMDCNEVKFSGHAV